MTRPATTPATTPDRPRPDRPRRSTTIEPGAGSHRSPAGPTRLTSLARTTPARGDHPSGDAETERTHFGRRTAAQIDLQTDLTENALEARLAHRPRPLPPVSLMHPDAPRRMGMARPRAGRMRTGAATRNGTNPFLSGPSSATRFFRMGSGIPLASTDGAPTGPEPGRRPSGDHARGPNRASRSPGRRSNRRTARIAAATQDRTNPFRRPSISTT
jgi:hypothetical protein